MDTKVDYKLQDVQAVFCHELLGHNYIWLRFDYAIRTWYTVFPLLEAPGFY